METQLGFFDAILDMFYLKPLFFLGLLLILLALYFVLKIDAQLPRIRTIVSTLLLYYYLGIILKNIVGMPTVKEFFRLARLGEAFFNPNLNFTPMVSGLNAEFLLNVFCFIPLGFLCPVISKTFEQMKKTVLLGFVLSLLIEVSQLFTLYRATDINDLLANTLGTIIGFLCIRAIMKSGIIRSANRPGDFREKDAAWYLPIVVVIVAFVNTFIS